MKIKRAKFKVVFRGQCPNCGGQLNSRGQCMQCGYCGG